jgi:branched-chain amino acid transport system substrate-binding protein
MRSLIVVGLIAGFTSSDPNTANEFRRGMEVFFKLHPQASKRLEVRVLDNKGDPAKTVELVQEEIKNGNKIFVGVSNSDEAIAASSIIEKQGALLITPFATNPKVTLGRKHTFRACYSDDVQGETLARFTGSELKPQSVDILINRDSHYSQGLAESYLQTLKASFPSIKTRAHFYSKTDYRWNEMKAEMEKSVPDLVFIPDHVTHAAILTKNINEVFPGRKFLGGDGWGGKKVLHAIHGENLPSSAYYSTHWDEAAVGKESDRFVSAYKKLFPEATSVSSGAALTYDSFLLLNHALKAWPGPAKDPNHLKLIEALERTKVTGVGGKIAYRPGKDHTPSRPVILINVKGGKYLFHKAFAP